MLLEKVRYCVAIATCSPRFAPRYTSTRAQAAAKLAGSYGALTSGTVAEGLRLLTGAPTLSLTVRTNELDHERAARASAAANGGRRRRRWGVEDDEFVLPDVCDWENDPSIVPPAAVLAALWARLEVSERSAIYASCVASDTPLPFARAGAPLASLWVLRATCLTRLQVHLAPPSCGASAL